MMVIVRLVEGRREDVGLCALAVHDVVGVWRKEGVSRAGVVLVVELEACSKGHGDTCR